MAAPSRYETPLEQVTRLLILAKRRGESWEEAWGRIRRPGTPPALFGTEGVPEGCALWPRDGTDRAVWIRAIDGAAEGFRRAYEDEPPTPAEVALVELAPAISRMAQAA